MNILIYTTNSNYVNKDQGGGAETSLRLIAEKFASIGENIIYVTLSKSKLPSIKVKIINNVKVYFISPFRWPSFKKGKVSKFKYKLIRLQLLYCIRKIIQNEKIQIVHTYNEYPNTFDILKIREKYKLSFKVILRLAGLRWYIACSKKPELISKVEWVFSKVDKIGFISEGLIDLFEDKIKSLHMNITPKNKVVLDIGYSDAIFNRKWTYKKTKLFKIVMVARFASYAKRQDLLVKSLHLIRDKNIELHFIGVGPNINKIKSLAHNYKLSDKVVFHGFLDQKEIQDILITSNLFCMATDYEGLCKSIIEAMSIGVPVLASNVTPINNYIKDQKNGFLCENNSEAWAKAIMKIYNGEFDLSGISENETKFIDQCYNPDRNIICYKKEFLKTIQN